MLLPMLRAVNSMLDIEGDDNPVTVCVKVNCARTILDEIIKSLEINPPMDIIQVPITAVIEKLNPVSKEKTQATRPVLEPKATLEPLPEVVTNGDEWMITLDEGGGLKIVDFPVDGLIELDGKKMPYSEARGMKFKKAGIL